MAETKPLSELTKKAELAEFAEANGLPPIDENQKVDEIRDNLQKQLDARAEQPSETVAPMEARRPEAGPVTEEPPAPEAPEAPATVPDDHYALDQIISNAETMLGEPGFLVEAAIRASAGDVTHLTVEQVRKLVDDFKALETEVA